MTDSAPFVDVSSSLDAEVSRAAPDLWLASRLVADPVARGALIALYALHAELAKVAGAASNPLAGEIRLAWWREEVEALQGKTRALGHPALQALAAALGLDFAALQAIIEARHAELDPQPFADEAQLVAYLDGVDGALMQAGACLLSPGVKASLVQAGRAWGWSRLLRERRAWRARGRDWLPAAWGQASDAEITVHVRHRVQGALAAAKVEAAVLPVASFPAVAAVTLTLAYAEGRYLSDLEKRARLLWASLRGRI